MSELGSATVTASKVELITLTEEKIPKYKLRVDTITGFTGYQHNDWIIQTPLIDLDAPIDLNPVILRETFNYFLLSGQRLSQMTKVYNDIDALTKLLEEKERDLELAARIGQSLLDQNRSQAEKIDDLEHDLAIAKDKIIQLRYEVSAKRDLLEIYMKDEEEDEELTLNSLNDSSISSYKSTKDVSQVLDELEKRVGCLEDENKKLKIETETRNQDIEEEERKEIQLINECAKRLKLANAQIVALQEEVSGKCKANKQLQNDISNLTNQVSSLEKELRKLTLENEELVSALNLAHECQSELTVELIDFKDKHTNLLVAFHEKQEECRELIKQQTLNDPLFSYSDSLAYELEQSFRNISNLEDETTNYPLDKSFNHCFTPDSLLSTESFYTTSPFASLGTTATQSDIKNSVPSNSTKAIVTSSTVQSQSTLPAIASSSKGGNSSRNHFFTNKLRYIKPIEGSQILNHWRKLATPNLNNLFDNEKEKFISRIHTNLAATEVKTSFALNKSLRSKSIDHSSPPVSPVSLKNNFVTTNSVFTFTTTSLSQTHESVTHVTTSFSDVQPTTGEYRKDSLVKGQEKTDDSKSESDIKTKMKSSAEEVSSESKEMPVPRVNQDQTESLLNQTQFKLDSLSGLNELAKLIRCTDNVRMASVMRPLDSNRRVITKVMASDTRLNAAASSSSNNIAKKDSTLCSKQSVLQNLRKGGFI